MSFRKNLLHKLFRRRFAVAPPGKHGYRPPKPTSEETIPRNCNRRLEHQELCALNKGRRAAVGCYPWATEGAGRAGNILTMILPNSWNPSTDSRHSAHAVVNSRSYETSQTIYFRSVSKDGTALMLHTDWTHSLALLCFSRFGRRRGVSGNRNWKSLLTDLTKLLFLPFPLRVLALPRAVCSPGRFACTDRLTSMPR